MTKFLIPQFRLLLMVVALLGAVLISAPTQAESNIEIEVSQAESSGGGILEILPYELDDRRNLVVLIPLILVGVVLLIIRTERKNFQNSLERIVSSYSNAPPVDNLPVDVTFTKKKFLKMITALCRGIMSPAVGKPIKVHVSSGRIFEPVNDGKFHIYLGAWSGERLSVPATTRSFNKNKLHTCAPSLVLPAQNSQVIIDDEGQIVGELIGDNHLYVFDLVFSTGLWSEAYYFAEVLAQARSIIEDEDSAEGFADKCLMLAEQSVAFAKPLDESESELKELSAQAETVHKEWAKCSLTPRLEAGREYDELIALNKVVSLKLAGDELKVVTENLYCQHPHTGDMHDIGAFEFTINTMHSWISFKNLTRQIHTSRDTVMQAPHISENGQPCYGNAGDTFTALLKQRDFANLVTMAIIFVESVNLDDAWGKTIDSWPVAQRYG